MRLLVLATALLMSGCATTYTCGQFPSSGCQPVSTVYERTNGGLNDYRQTLFDKKKEASGVSEQSTSSVEVGQAHQALNYIAPGTPILKKPVIMRILFNSWIDQDSDLNAGGYVFVRLRDAEWELPN